jgi:micrococcal nuclease
MYEYKITELVKIVDGDTIDVIIDIGFNILRRERIRLSRIDTPESNSKDEREKLLAFEAKEYLSIWLINQNTLKIKTTKDDKYGRYLGEIYGDDNVCINDVLIENGYAWKYDGGTKTKDLNLLLEKRK